MTGNGGKQLAWSEESGCSLTHTSLNMFTLIIGDFIKLHIRIKITKVRCIFTVIIIIIIIK